MKNIVNVKTFDAVNTYSCICGLWAYIKWKKIENIDIKIQELYINFALLLQD